MKNLRMFLSMAAIAGILASCSNDDDDPTPAPEQKDGIISSTEDPDFNPAALAGIVKGDITLSAATAYTLTGSLKVEEPATLNIGAGTTIKTHAASESDRTKLFISISPGAKIMANGTATAPIVITSDDSSPKAGAWGGLLIAGKARQNKNDGGTAVAEVGDLTYGGNDDADNSGVIKYVVLKYTGSVINDEAEFNGFTFYAVGSGTTVENIAVFNGSDDAIEFFGGTVNVTNGLGVNVKDDIFDWTDGWRGTATNFFGVREDGFDLESQDPRGLEGDNNENDITASPRSNPTFDGLTLVNKSNSIAFNDAIKVRRGSDITIKNALLMLPGTAGAGDFIDLTDGKGPANTVAINISSEDYTIVDVKNEQAASDDVPASTIDLTNVTVGAGNTGADSSVFEWTGFTNF